MEKAPTGAFCMTYLLYYFVHWFNNHLYTGTWYEIYFQNKNFYGPDDLWEDYRETYTLQPNGNLSVEGLGRKPSKRSDVCTALTTATLVNSAQNGKLDLIAYGHSRDFWILDTDYTEFSVTYGCRRLDTNGACTLNDTLDAWIWSRETTLSTTTLAHAQNILRKACVNFTELTATPINRDCTLSIPVGK